MEQPALNPALGMAGGEPPAGSGAGQGFPGRPHRSSLILHLLSRRLRAHFPEQKSSLIDALHYEPDTLVVLDSFFLRVHRIREEVCFVTTDNAHILENRDRIEEILPGIAVREPGSFLAGEGG